MNRPSIALLATLAAPAGLVAQTPVDVDARVESLLKRLTIDEKLSLLAGTGFDTRPIERLGISGLHMTDGPVGVRSGKSTAFPASIALAASFDPDLVERVGQALGREAKGKGKNVLLAPCVNIQRTPFGGRNFESYGEDPFLAARMAVSYVKGVQSEGVVATVKHLAVNNQEFERTTINAVVDERALHEIYYPAFKAAVQEAGVQAVMCSYNKLNGPWACENPPLLGDVLKKTWGFRGLVMSDWGATHSVAPALNAGLDLEMPDGRFLNPENLKKALASGELKEATIDDAVGRQLRVMASMGYLDKKLDGGAVDSPEHRALAREAGREGIVLLKNDRRLLPLEPAKLKRVAVIGPNAAMARTGGGGSALVEPVSAVSPLEALKARLGTAKVDYAPGALIPEDVRSIPATALRTPAGEPGLRAEYFDNEGMSGAPALVRVDPQVAFDWGDKGPGAPLGKDHFSARWTGTITAPDSGHYILGVSSDDGTRLFLDGKPVVDNWGTHAVLLKTTELDLKAGEAHDVRLEFYEGAGDAGVFLVWQRVEADPRTLALEKAKGADVVLLFVGSTARTETEGVDRETLELTGEQAALVKAVAQINPNTVVVLDSGAPVLMGAWLDSVPALLEVWFPGEEVGNAVADVLLGDHNPSGKLPATFLRRWEDSAAFGNYPGKLGEVRYAEGLFVGYRHFDKKGIEPQFPFGFGLSYTTFAYRDLEVAPVAGPKRGFEARFFVKNTGAREGAEVAQLYVHPVAPKVERPVQELKGFRKVALKPGEEKEVRIALDDAAFAFYDPGKKNWVVDPGEYEIRVSASSRDVRLKTPLSIR